MLKPSGSPALAASRAGLVRLTKGQGAECLADAVRHGLTTPPRSLPCRFFYDAAGSRLFEQICGVPEYYLTRTEDAILHAHASAMVDGLDGDGPPALVELGSGSSTKTRRLLDAVLAEHETARYLPIDVSETILESSARALAREYPTLRVTGIVGEYGRALAHLRGRLAGGPTLVVFLGSSLGNLDDHEAVGLLRQVAEAVGPGGGLLLGTDLAKDRATLEAAYDDPQGLSAAFNRNILARINRELGADFDLDQFVHQAAYRPERGRVEMHLVSQRDQVVRVPGADLTLTFAAGEAIHTENSHKYTVGRLRGLAQQAGFEEDAAWADPRGWFRVQRWRVA